MHDGMHLIINTHVDYIPALYHDVVDVPRAAWRRGEAETNIYLSDDLLFGIFLERFVPETPYLIHYTTKAPHITGCGVLLVMESLFTVH